MLGKAHLAIGMAAAWTLTLPETMPAALPVIAGAAKASADVTVTTIWLRRTCAEASKTTDCTLPVHVPVLLLYVPVSVERLLKL